jgi:hypothetical protein
MQCLGGDIMGPQPGYWRPEDLSIVFEACPNLESCLGMTEQEIREGVCESGYSGVQCA